MMFPRNILNKEFWLIKEELFGFIIFEASIHEKKQVIMKSDSIGLFPDALR